MKSVYLVFNIQIADGVQDGFYWHEAESLQEVLAAFDDESGRFVPQVYSTELMEEYPYFTMDKLIYDGYGEEV